MIWPIAIWLKTTDRDGPGPCLRFPSPRSFTSFCMVALSCTSMPLITCSGKNRIHIAWDFYSSLHTYACVCVHMYVSMYRWMDEWMDGRMHVCMYTWSCMMMHDHLWWCICMIMYDYMHVDMEVWMCEYSPRRCSSCCMSHLRHPVSMSRVYSSYASRMTFKWRFPKRYPQIAPNHPF